MDDRTKAALYGGLFGPQGRAEAYGQGATFGFGDEIGAEFQAELQTLKDALEGASRDEMARNRAGTYGQARFENRDTLQKYREESPVEAGALEFTGSVPSSIATGGRGAASGAQNVGMAARIGGSPLKAGVGAAMKSGAKFGGAYGLGASEGRTPMEWARDAFLGAGKGALAAGGLRAAGNVATNLPGVRNVISALARKELKHRIEGRPEPKITPPDQEVTEPSAAVLTGTNPSSPRALGAAAQRASMPPGSEIPDSILSNPSGPPPTPGERQAVLETARRLLAGLGRAETEPSLPRVGPR